METSLPMQKFNSQKSSHPLGERLLKLHRFSRCGEALKHLSGIFHTAIFLVG
jgi:hypothetical protein